MIDGTDRAGLKFSVARCKEMIEKKSSRVSETAGVYLAGVLEYLTAEILELAGNACKDERKKVITPYHVKKVVENDQELLILIFEQNILLPGTMNVKYPRSKKNIPLILVCMRLFIPPTLEVTFKGYWI